MLPNSIWRTVRFGESGSGMALALRDGARAIDDARRAAHEAGVVLSNDLAPGVEKLNDDFTRLTQQIEIGFKKAVLNSVGFLGQLKAAAAEAARYGATGETQIGALGAAAGAAITPQTPQTIGDLWSSLGWGTPPTGKATVIPSTTIKTKQERDSVEELIKSLQSERDLIGASDTERAISTSLRQAGADATAEQKQRIIDLVVAIRSEQGVLAAAAKAQETFTGLAHDFLGGFIDDLNNSVSPIEALTNALKRLESQLLDMALNAAIKQLATSLFGGGMGGALGGGFGGMGIGGRTLSTLYHGGGVVGAGGGARRSVPTSLYALAPRFHGGLTSNEFPAILQAGERVLTKQVADRTAGTMAGLAELSEPWRRRAPRCPRGRNASARAHR